MYKVYLAAPWFNDSQLKRIEFVETELFKRFTVYSPRKEINLPTNQEFSEKERQKVIDANIEAIKASDFIVTITDEKDLGTMFDTGAAYILQKPIIYVAFTLGKKPFNLMLTNTGIAIAKNEDDLISILSYIHLRGLKARELKDYKFQGKIQ